MRSEIPAVNNASLATSTINGTGDGLIWGWTPSATSRGTMDILWSSVLTIGLCCWVATYPNARGPKDKWYHSLIDKANLAVIGLMGPELLFGLALGQYSSAANSVDKFKEYHRSENRDGPPVLITGTWTLAHAFFLDMGGLHLTSPDFPDGFPIDAEQFFYLAKNQYIEVLNVDTWEISERNTVDSLSRAITAIQALWFLVTQAQRYRMGLPLTTIELTALSFSIVMFFTTVVWSRKPAIGSPQFIQTKGGKHVADIRRNAKQLTHWYRTPLDFIRPVRFGINVHWQHCSNLPRVAKFPFVSRPMKDPHAWDRFPSDIYLCPRRRLFPIGFIVQSVFSVMFLLAWDFHFPTQREKIMWRVAATYHAVFSIYVGFYYLIETFRTKRKAKKETSARQHCQSPPGDVESQGAREPNYNGAGGKRTGRTGWGRSIVRWILSWRNISPDGDPSMDVSLRMIFPVFIITSLYLVCRAYFYVEDILSLRAQPPGAFQTGNTFMPF